MTLEAGAGFVAGNPQVVVDDPYATIIPGCAARMYDVSRDGQRFLMIKAVESAQQAAPPPQIIVVQNWHEELKRLVPTR
jgi:serine/threonine-protein kinase